MKRFVLGTLAFVFFFSCEKESVQNTLHLQHTPQDIDAFIYSYTDQGTIFDWSFATDEMIHSAAMLSDSILAIGYQTDGFQNAKDFIGTTDQLDDEWLDKRQSIINYVFEEEKKLRPDANLEDVVAFELDDQIPTMELKTTSLNVITTLRSDPSIRYVEPMGYELKIVSNRSSSGCGSGNTNINGGDYTSVSPTAKVPWNFYKHNIDKAWNTSTGNNIGICIVDTGASDNQDNLGSKFNSGNSSGRNLEKKSTKYSGAWWWKTLDPPHDQCGHGTSMAGLAAGPWSNDGNAVGAAYNSDLVTIRAVEDVVISSTNEKKGVKEALKIVGNRNDLKMASMSIGNIISSGTVKDGVYYAYNRGKMLIAAAGTSFSWTNWVGVIFPANMNETVAVTGIKDKSSYQRCNTCHSGSKVDFTIKMQRSNNNDRNSLSITLSGNAPRYISGSSSATATFAGVTALVWATNSSMSRSTVMNRLKNASQNYPSRNNNYGWGNINAEAAVLGLPY